MSQIASIETTPAALRGAAIMVAAGLAFAGLNIAVQWASVNAGASAPAIAFWQYAIALALAAPLVWRGGVHILHTRHVVLHLARVILAAAGVQLWVYGLSVVPIWQAIALAMTSPFFVMAGAGLVLRERVDRARIAATVAGFAGAMIIIAPWSERFTYHAVLPVLAAACWAGTSLITKYLTRLEPTAGITVYLLLLLTPINAAIWLGFRDPATGRLGSVACRRRPDRARAISIGLGLCQRRCRLSATVRRFEAAFQHRRRLAGVRRRADAGLLAGGGADRCGLALSDAARANRRGLSPAPSRGVRRA